MAQNLTVKTQLFLLKDGLLGSQLFRVRRDLHVLSLLLDEVSLVGNPLLLDLHDFFFKFLGLLEDVVLLGFHGSRVFIDTCIFQQGPSSVELVHLELLLVNPIVTLLDVLLELLDL